MESQQTSKLHCLKYFSLHKILLFKFGLNLQIKVAFAYCKGCTAGRKSWPVISVPTVTC